MLCWSSVEKEEEPFVLEGGGGVANQRGASLTRRQKANQTSYNCLRRAACSFIYSFASYFSSPHTRVITRASCFSSVCNRRKKQTNKQTKTFYLSGHACERSVAENRIFTGGEKPLRSSEMRIHCGPTASACPFHH